MLLRVLAMLLLPATSLVAQQRPNILFIYSDDHAAHAVSAYRKHLGYAIGLPATPNLDRIARDGMLFQNAFVTNSICGPARAAVLTGQYGHLNGVMTNAEALHPTTVTFPKLLRAAGYRTFLFGKWHLKERPAGFDHYEILQGQGSYYNPIVLSEGDSARVTGYTQDLITDRALQWLDQERGESPWLLMLHYNAPHRFWDPGPGQLGLYRTEDLPEPATLFDDGRGRVFPAQEPEMTIAQDLVERDLKLVEPINLTAEQLADWRRWYDPENAAFRAAGLTGTALTRWKYQRYIKDYMRAVQGIDENVGRVLDYLERNGLAGNTLVIYTSDQGFFLGDHGWFDKRWMYEESLRTPLLVRWPGVVKRGAINRDLVMNLDIAQTLLDVAGVSAPAAMQGASFAPLLRGERMRNWRDAIYYQYFAYPDWHMVQRQYGVRDHRYKLIHYYEVGKWELFDLRRDPQELRSVYGDRRYQDVVKRMQQKLATLRAQYQAPEHDPVPHTPWVAPPEYRRKR